MSAITMIFVAIIRAYIPLFSEFAALALVGGTRGYMVGNAIQGSILEGGDRGVGSAMSFLLPILSGEATLFVAGFIGQASLLPCRVETAGASTVDVMVADGTRVPATRAGLTGCDAMLAIRPEHMRLSTERPDGDTPAISVTVAEEVFQGSVVRYQLDGPAGVRLTATVPLEERADVHGGSAAWARWLPDWGYVLPVTTPSAAVAEPSAEEGSGAAAHA